MSEDIDTGSISPPRHHAERAIDLNDLNESELETHVNDLLASVGEGSSGPGGGVASLAAVWVISQVENACGGERLVNPQDLTKDDFASPTVLSRMLHRQIRKQDPSYVES